MLQRAYPEVALGRVQDFRSNNKGRSFRVGEALDTLGDVGRIGTLDCGQADDHRLSITVSSRCVNYVAGVRSPS